MEERLNELREEYRRGIEAAMQLDQRRAELARTLLRISGAIQVLEEMRRPSAPGAAPGAAPTPPPAAPRMSVVGG